jgi:hypothetical protein
VFDIPKMHHFTNRVGRELFNKIANSDDTQLFDQLFVQALIEYQWPPVRAVIIRSLLVPYLVFLICFSCYSIYFFEQLDKGHLSKNGVVGMRVT